MPETHRPWKRRSAARPAELRTAALRRFAERGYCGTTIEDVAQAADVTVGTVYRYFTDKRALLASLVDWAASIPLAGPTSPPAADPSESLRLLLRQIWTASRGEPHAGVLRILVAEGGTAPDLVTRYRQAVLEPAAALLAPHVRQASDPGLAARALLGHLLGASVLAGAAPAVQGLIPQLDPMGPTIDRLVGPETTPAAAREPAAPPPARRFSGPESW